MNQHEFGIESGLLDNKDAEEIYTLAMVGLYHIQELEQELKATEQSRLQMQTEDKEELKEHRRLESLFYERRNGSLKAKNACLNILRYLQNVKFSRMMKESREKK